MDRNDAIKTLSSERPLFSEFLAFDLDERQGLIEKHKTELKYICKLADNYIEDVNFILLNRMPISMISNLTYNLVHNLTSCYVGLTVYDYLQTAYLIDEDYDANYERWNDFSQCARQIEKIISNLRDVNIFNIGEPSGCENLQPLVPSDKRVPLSLLNLQHMLSKINGESLFVAILDYIRGIESRLETIKTGINNLTDDDFETIFNANYTLYVENYWPNEGKNFRKHIEDHYFRGRGNKIETLEKLLIDEQRDFERDGTGVLWRDYFHDKKTLYFEMRRAKLNEEQWKYFFKKICRFEEYEKWIDELEHPEVEGKDFPESEWDKIFNDAIDVKKVKIALQKLLPSKISITTWYIIYKIFFEIDWLHDTVTKHFISWVKDVYGWQYKTEDFKNSVNSELKLQHSLDWNTRTMTSAKIAKDNIYFAESVRKEFVLEMDGKTVKVDNNYYFKKPELYISHPLKQ